MRTLFRGIAAFVAASVPRWAWIQLLHSVGTVIQNAAFLGGRGSNTKGTLVSRCLIILLDECGCYTQCINS